MAKEPRHERLYKKKPTLERGEDGHVGVKEKEADKVQSGVDGMKMEETHGEGMPMHVRHSAERHDMHKRHEMEHAVHDHHKAGHKKELHKRHQEEMKAMHGRHEKEIEAGESKEMTIGSNNENKKGEKAEEKEK